MSNRVITVIRSIILYLVLEKEIGPRLFLPNADAISGADGGRIIYYSEFFIGMGAIGLFILHAPRVVRYLVRTPELIVYLVFVVCAVLLPSSNRLKDSQTVISFLEPIFALSVVILYDGRERAQQILLRFFSFAIIANAASIVVPSMSLMQGSEHAGTFRGLMVHRGDLGFMLSIAAVIVLSYMRTSLFKTILIILCVAMLVGTQSVQGAILTIVGVTITLTLRTRGSASFARGAGLLAVIGIGTVITTLAPESINDALGVFGRDLSFTGRDRVWSLAWYLLKDVPTFGYGMFRFNREYIPLEVLNTFGLGSEFGSTHSSYLEAVYSFGWIGGGIFFVVVARQVLNWLITVFGFRDIEDAAPLALTFFCVIGGITAAEKMFLPGSGWLCFVIARTMLDAERRRRKQPIVDNPAAELNVISPGFRATVPRRISSTPANASDARQHPL